MFEIKNVVVVVVFIFLKHNDLCGRAISGSQLCFHEYCAQIFLHL